MRFTRFAPSLAGVAGLALLAACAGRVVPPAAPPPAPAPAPTPTPAPPPPPAPTYSNWEDAPQTPGDWSYASGTATFGLPGQPRLELRCSRADATVAIGYLGAPAGSMVIRTEAAERTLQTINTGGPRIPGAGLPSGPYASIPARDALLDAIAFSKGRFAVEVSGVETLYLPSWPEISRVIEDCR